VGRFTKSLHLLEEDGSESTLYSADPAVDGDSGEVVFSAEAGSGLRLGFREDASVGNLAHYAQLRVEAISGTCAGERLADWEHDEAHQESPRAPSVCLQKDDRVQRESLPKRCGRHASGDRKLVLFLVNEIAESVV
jgi:hypothetical protein